MFSVIKRQNQPSDEDDIEIQEILDPLLIEKEKLMVHYDRHTCTMGL
jgi:hypothetical protein